MKNNARTRAPAGYLLLEALIAGAVLAVALSAAVSFIANSRFETTMSARIGEASGLAEQKVAELLAGPQVTVALTGPVSFVDHPGFEVSWEVRQSGLESKSIPVLIDADALHELVVQISYPSSRGPQVYEVRRLRHR